VSFPNIIYTSSEGLAHRQNDSTVKGRMMGRQMEYEDGRKWRFVENGATLLVPGDLVQGPAVVTADYTDIIVDAAAAIGATTLSVTPTTTTAANTYGDPRGVGAFGHCFVNKGGVRAARVYRVASHIIFSAAAGVLITLQDPVETALAVNDEVGFAKNVYTDVIQAIITTITNRIVGVAQTPITADYFGWLQTGGIAAVNQAASMVVGNKAGAIVAAAGRAGVSTAILDVIGVNLSVPTTAGEFGAVYLTMD